jgi:hypothetical protein
MAEEESEEGKIVLEALLGESLLNYFLKHDILKGSWDEVILNYEIISLILPHLGPQFFFLLGVELRAWKLKSSLVDMVR